MSVLVTGGCGFIGSYTVRDLVRAGRDVVVTDVRGPDLLADVVTGDLGAGAMPPVYPVDITDVTGLLRVCTRHRVRAVVHAAGLLSEGCAAAPAHAAMVNVVGTAALFELAASAGIENIVWTSSISVFGYRASGARVRDDSPTAPNTFYGLYKATNEQQAALYYEHFGIPSTGVRIGFAYGYGRTRGRGSWVQELLAKPALGQPGRVTGGDALVPWLHVTDAADALVKALDAAPDGARVFNTQGTPRWKHEAIEYVKRLLPGADLELVGEPEGYPTGLVDSGIRTTLGWAPALSLEQGIEESINRYRRAAGLPAVGSAR
jgi:nucleoside-diphosphate-sugar epimerase